jgi:hypothetical protein
LAEGRTERKRHVAVCDGNSRLSFVSPFSEHIRPPCRLTTQKNTVFAKTIWGIGSEVLTAVAKKSSIFWDITPCNPWKFKRHFGGSCRLHLRGRRVCQARSQHEIGGFHRKSVVFKGSIRGYISEYKRFHRLIWLYLGKSEWESEWVRAVIYSVYQHLLPKLGTSGLLRPHYVLYQFSWHPEYYYEKIWEGSVTVAARSKAWTVFVRWNTAIVGSNPNRGMDVCVCLFCVYVLCVGSGPATGWSPVQGVLPTVQCKRSRNWKVAMVQQKGCTSIDRYFRGGDWVGDNLSFRRCIGRISLRRRFISTLLQSYVQTLVNFKRSKSF